MDIGLLLLFYIDSRFTIQGNIVPYYMENLEPCKNKYLKLLINVGFIVSWYLFCVFLIEIDRPLFTFVCPQDIHPICDKILWWYTFSPWWVIIRASILFVPILLGTRYIWFKRIKPSPKITRSKD